MGEVEYSSISEMLVPSYDGSYEYFIKQKFQSRPMESTWQIRRIERPQNNILIIVDPISVPVCVTKHAASQQQKVNNLLTEFAIVEVDFGFYSNTLNINGDEEKNHSNTTTLMKGEMHKRRPCVLLKINQFTAQVIPLTSNPKRINYHLDIKVDLSKIAALNDRYKIDSFALIEMIQTVSHDRIFPPKASDGKYKHNYFKYKLIKEDKEAIKVGLASQYNSGANSVVSDLTDKVTKLSEERRRLFKTNTESQSQIKAKNVQISEMESLIINLGKFFDLGSDVESIKRELTKVLK